MGQSANPRRTGENEAKAFARYVRTSPQKLNLVAQMIRGKNAARALVDLQFSKRRVAVQVRQLLQSAISNAENNHGMDVDRLVVSEATVGKTFMMKRFHARGRGRGARILKKVSNITIIVREADMEAKVKKEKKNTRKVGATKTDEAKPVKSNSKKPKETKE
jgi:large subunit ribosomal protein L22